VLIEIQTRDQVAVHTDVAEAVDSLLRGNPIPPENRFRDEAGEIRIMRTQKSSGGRRDPQGFRRQAKKPVASPSFPEDGRQTWEETPAPRRENLETVHIFPYGVARNRLIQAAKQLGVPIVIEKVSTDAQVVVTLRTHFRKRKQPIVDAENRGVPVYVLRSNTITQMERFLSGLFNLTPSGPRVQNEEETLQQTQNAINTVLNGERWVELSPASSYIRRLQHQMARQANLYSYSYGKEPNRRVRIYRE
jgi:hypothetical protein